MPKKSRSKLPRRERRDLDIEIEFIEGVVKRDPSYVEALQILGDDYTRRGKFTKGLHVDKQLASLRPDDPETQFNLACSLSLTGNLDGAANALHRALDFGYDDLHWLSRDPDLAPLRKHPSYKELRKRIRELRSRSTAA